MADDFRGSTILVSGASGLIGSAIVRALCAREGVSRVVGLYRSRDRITELFPNPDAKITFLPWRMTDAVECPEAVDHVIHAAGSGNPADFQSCPADACRDTFLGCQNILDFAVAKKARRFVLVSSGEVYGTAKNGGRFLETDPCALHADHPRSAYPLAKLAAESLALGYGRQYDFDVCIARLCHVYGPGANPRDSRIAAQFPLSAIRDGNVSLKSDGRQLRSLCYVEDAAEGILAILWAGSGGEVYNVADENTEVTIRQFAERIADVSGATLSAAPATATETPHFNPMPYALYDTGKLRRLGWRAATTLDEGLKRTVAYFRGIEKTAPIPEGTSRRNHGMQKGGSQQ